jgi:DNA-binding response OmpR family regulator
MDEEKNIILADDEVDLLEIFSRALEQNGFKVFLAENGEEVFTRLEEVNNQVNIILLDILMPKMDGFDTLKKIRKKDELKSVKVVMLTNLDSPDDRQKAIESGADGYLVKASLTPSQLVEEVAKIIG